MSEELIDTAQEIHEVAVAERKVNRNTLYHLSMDYQALLDMEEDELDEDTWNQYKTALAQKGPQQVQKVQDTGMALLYIKGMRKSIKEEKERLKAADEYFERRENGLQSMIEYVIKALGKEIRGKKESWKKLMGRTLSLGLRNNPGAVKVDDMEQLPPRYKRHRISVWGDTWAEVLGCLPQELKLRLLQEINEVKFDTDYSATRIKEDMLEKGLDVPGADIEYTQSVTVR